MKSNANSLAAAAAVLAACILALPQPALAQSLGDMLKSSVKRAVQSETERQVDKTTRKVVRCAFGDEECIQAAKRSGAQVEVQPPPASQPGTATATASAPATATRSMPGNIKPVPTGPAVPLAQMQANCDKEAVMRTAAVRKETPYNPKFPGASAVQAKIKPVFADFAPNGFETEGGGIVYASSGSAWQPAYMRPWGYAVSSHPYGCLSNGKFYKDSHFAIVAYVEINQGLGDGPYALPAHFDPNSENSDHYSEDAKLGFFRLYNHWLVNGLPQAKDGYFHVPDEYTDLYLFTRDGRLPFAYVTREEFLRKQIEILQVGMADERSKQERAFASAGQQPDYSRIDPILAYGYEKPIARYRQLLNQPAAWLQQPTIVRPNRGSDDASYEFFDAPPGGSDVLVPIKPDPTYLNPSKPAGAPQYLFVHLKNSHARGEYYQLRDLVERNVDTFKSLVD